MFTGKKSAQIREILISESAWEEMTCLFAPSLEKRIQKQSKRIVAVKSDKISTRYSTLGSWESNEAMMLENINKHIKSRMKYV